MIDWDTWDLADSMRAEMAKLRSKVSQARQQPVILHVEAPREPVKYEPGPRDAKGRFIREKPKKERQKTFEEWLRAEFGTDKGILASTKRI
jgi:hypothetical protein